MVFRLAREVQGTEEIGVELYAVEGAADSEHFLRRGRPHHHTVWVRRSLHPTRPPGCVSEIPIGEETDGAMHPMDRPRLRHVVPPEAALGGARRGASTTPRDIRSHDGLDFRPVVEGGPLRAKNRHGLRQKGLSADGVQGESVQDHDAEGSEAVVEVGGGVSGGTQGGDVGEV